MEGCFPTFSASPKYEYDHLGRKIKTIDPDNHTTQTKYDEAGNITWVKDGNGNKTSYNYDKLNRQTEIIDANNILIQATKYDGFGNIKAVKDSGGNITRYDYDNLNRQTAMTDPHGKTVSQHYDGLSRVDWSIDRNGHKRDFTYDINDNLLTEHWDNGVQLTFTYDKVGNLKSSYDATSNTTNVYNYDEIYQLTDKTTGNTKFHYDYDVYSDLTKREDWLNSSKIATLDYTYDKNHQLKHLTQTGTGVITQNLDFSYDRFNQLSKIDRSDANDPKHLITDYQYTAAGLLADINNYLNTTANPISHYHYGYDAGNRLMLTTGTDGSSAVNYGNDNQLQSVNKSTGANESYSFDALGIRNTWTTVTGDSRQILTDGKYEYRYDDEGNLSQKKELLTGNLTNYEWDYRNRLIKVTSGSQVVEYLYDAEDRRVGKKVNGVVKEKYVYDGADIALVVDGAGTLVERYLFGDGTDNVLSREQGGAVVWSLGDRQGSVVDLVDEHGVVLNHFVYDGFGNQTGSTTADFRYGYTGRELDGETGLYYYRARYYDPKVGRFISEDPLGFGAGDTNLYRYVFNSPTNHTDPSGQIIPFILAGLAAWGEIALTAGAIGAAVGAVYGFATEAIGSLAKDYDSGHLSFDSIGRAVGHGVEGAKSVAVYGFALGVTSTIPVVGNLAVGGFLGYGAITSAQRSADAFEHGNNATGIFELTNALLGAKFAGKHLGQGVADVQSAYSSLRERSRADTLNRVETGLDSLTNQTHVLSNIIESADARSGSGFGAFSKGVYEHAPQGYNSKTGPRDLLLEDGETLNPIYRDRVQTLVTAENLTYRSGNLSQTKITTLQRISQFLGGSATIGLFDRDVRRKFRNNQKSVSYANIDVEGLPSKLHSFSGTESPEGAMFRSYPDYIERSQRQLRPLKFQGSRLEPAADGESKIAELPHNALLILCRLPSYDFYLIEANGEEDSPVFYCDGKQILKEFDSFWDVLRMFVKGLRIS